VEEKMKKIIIAAVIIFFVLVGIVGSIDEEPANILIHGFKEKPVLNGVGDRTIGHYGYVEINKSSFKAFCKDEILINFVNFAKKKDLLYVIIDFGDGTGLHGVESLYTYCKISKDKNGTFEAGKYLGDLKIYTDSKKVDRSNLEF
jgi:hypothetical protein